MKQQTFGVTKSQEFNGRVVQDTRTPFERFAGAFAGDKPGPMLIMGGVLAFLVPGLADILLAVGIPIFFWALRRPIMLPFFMPRHSKAADYNDLHPATNAPQPASGITFLGNERETNEELWFNSAALRAHILLFGTTGGGKTEALVSLAYNSLAQGSGFIYVDGKGDYSLAEKILSISRNVGREDDLLIINFMTGGRDLYKATTETLSNTLNPFSFGSASMLSELLNGLMGGDTGGKDGMWTGRAQTFMSSMVRILVYMRDITQEIQLSISEIRKYMELKQAVTLIQREDIPMNIREGLYYYVRQLPGMDDRQLQTCQFQPTVLDQHGYITMQWTQVLNMLSDDYGHIFNTPLGDVDFRDIVLNRRILVVLLPALEKSDISLANLGRIIVASLKAMMGSSLGRHLEGKTRDVIDARPTNAETPFTCILDEYGYYAVKGMAVAAAQSRSLNFSMVFAGQDYQAFQKSSKEEAASIVANTSIKICMKLEDPEDTLKIFTQRADEAIVAERGALTKKDMGSHNYLDTGTVNLSRRKRISIRDLASLKAGQAAMIFGDTLRYARLFYANPRRIEEMRFNTFLRVAAPDDDMVRALGEDYSALAGRFSAFLEDNSTEAYPEVEPLEDLDYFRHAFAEIDKVIGARQVPGIERGIAALFGYTHQLEVLDNEFAERLQGIQPSEQDIPNGLADGAGMGYLDARQNAGAPAARAEADLADDPSMEISTDLINQILQIGQPETAERQARKASEGDAPEAADDPSGGRPETGVRAGSKSGSPQGRPDGKSGGTPSTRRSPFEEALTQAQADSSSGRSPTQMGRDILKQVAGDDLDEDIVAITRMVMERNPPPTQDGEPASASPDGHPETYPDAYPDAQPDAVRATDLMADHMGYPTPPTPAPNRSRNQERMIELMNDIEHLLNS